VNCVCVGVVNIKIVLTDLTRMIYPCSFNDIHSVG
jgi:hypothetical protein